MEKEVIRQEFFKSFGTMRHKTILTAMSYINCLLFQLHSKCGYRVFYDKNEGMSRFKEYAVNRSELDRMRRDINNGVDLELRFPTTFVKDHCDQYSPTSNHSKGTLITIRNLLRDLSLISFTEGDFILGHKSPPITVHHIDVDHLLLLHEYLESIVGVDFLVANVKHGFYTTFLLFNHVFGLVKEALSHGKELVLLVFNRLCHNTESIKIFFSKQHYHLSPDIGELYPDPPYY
jgi:hypothetical protein